MTCPCCNAARETDGWSRQYDSLKCLWCAARLIKQIGGLPIAQSEATARRHAVLTDAIARGLSEKDIRAMVDTRDLLAPVAEKKKKG